MVPLQLSVGFDIRFPPTVDPNDLENMLQGMCKDAGEDVILDIQEKVRVNNFEGLSKLTYLPSFQAAG